MAQLLLLKPAELLLGIISALSLLSPRTAEASTSTTSGGKPLVTAITKDTVPTVALGSHIPYTVLRPDVFAPFVRAFDVATPGRERVNPPTPPFELCYDSRELGSTRLGYAVPQVDLMLESGANWTVFGGNSMVQVSDNTACFAFLDMKEGGHGYGYGGAAAPAPAVVIGGFQMENNLLVFDEKGLLGFSGLLFGRQTTCSNFNFTLAG